MCGNDPQEILMFFRKSSVLALFAIVFSAFNQASAQDVKSDIPEVGTVPVPYRGVDRRIKLDDWTSGLLKPKEGGLAPKPNQVASRVKSTFYDTIPYGRSTEKFFNSLVKSFAFSYGSEQFAPYAKVAQQLLTARDDLRVELDETRIEKMCERLEHNPKACEAYRERVLQVIILLQVMAEETLYVGTQLVHKNAPVEVRWASRQWRKVEVEKKAELFGGKDDPSGIFQPITVFEGDVVLSKGGSGSSSFLARITKYPGAFSHSTLAAFKGDELRFPEAFIEDGVKLRNPQAGYIDHRKKKLFIYRYRSETADGAGSEFRASISKGIQDFIQIMNDRSSGDPETVASFDYDFAMNASESEKLFCSEVVYHIYGNSLGLVELQNPYPSSLWGTIEGMTKEFFDKFLGISVERFPSPSDVENNSQYGLAGYSMMLREKRVVEQADGTKKEVEINLTAEERVDTALIDTILYVMDKNKELVHEYLEAVKDVGNDPITDEQIAFVKFQLKTAHGIEIPENVLKALQNRPKNITTKQLLFFAYLNDVMTPSIRETVDFKAPVPPLKLRSDMVGHVEKHLKDLTKLGMQLAQSATAAQKKPASK